MLLAKQPKIERLCHIYPKWYEFNASHHETFY